MPRRRPLNAFDAAFRMATGLHQRLKQPEARLKFALFLGPRKPSCQQKCHPPPTAHRIPTGHWAAFFSARPRRKGHIGLGAAGTKLLPKQPVLPVVVLRRVQPLGLASAPSPPVPPCPALTPSGRLQRLSRSPPSSPSLARRSGLALGVQRPFSRIWPASPSGRLLASLSPRCLPFRSAVLLFSGLPISASPLGTCSMGLVSWAGGGHLGAEAVSLGASLLSTWHEKKQDKGGERGGGRMNTLILHTVTPGLRV